MKRRETVVSVKVTWVACLAGALLAVSLTGCATVDVKPWERGTLADYTMRPDRDPLEDILEEHIYFTREAAAGGRGVGGGGCGCN